MTMLRLILRVGYPSITRSTKRTIATPSTLCLVPIGRTQPAGESPYEPGQLILHRQFGYRGVILQKWSTRLYDKSVVLGNQSNSPIDPKEFGGFDENTASPQEGGRDIYGYTVLLDKQDASMCNNSLVAGISFLPEENSLFNAIYMMSGMDYAFHDDLIPYTCSSAVPLRNDYFEEFLQFVPDREPHFRPTDRLQQWLKARHSSLRMKSAYRETSEGFRVTVAPFHMGHRKFRYSEGTMNHYWRYLVRIENLTDESYHLRERFWKLFSINGSLESVSGKGVVGMQPMLAPHMPLFQYHSHVQVPVSWAHMWGQYRLEKANGATVDVKIPVFPLCCREEEGQGPQDSAME